jgi:hypothetical protein
MHKHIVATGALDKSIAFGGIKPLHNTFFFHYKLSYNIVSCRQERVPDNKKATTENVRSSSQLSRCLCEQPFDTALTFSQIGYNRVKKEIISFG